MASRTLTPLRAISRSLRTPTNSQTWAATTPHARTISTTLKPKLASTPYTRAASPTATTPYKAAPATTKPATSSSSTKPTSTDTRTPIPPTSGDPLPEAPPYEEGDGPIDWSQSFHGLGESTFSPEAAATLQAPLDPEDVEVKPDGVIYLPEIKYRRILNAAFGPGAWGLAPRGQLTVHERLVTREYALIVQGKFVAQARGEQQYFNEEGISTAAEGAKSNALMRCCKDLGVASELWDPRFIRKFTKEHAVQQWAEHVTTKKRKQVWLRKDDELRYPFKKV
ncbi:Mgm101p-domain-containing protein [Hypoxylon fragiforme]|uniref:Mgm101p-domain-containing protein n=1 Tax=Hypoxylon fragiforme TaxID=63214 RepID=UPI0020C6E6DC|nr:Mgm101p-domain-containing protein [Hypoxylon fragiforme]KAI2609588.1 Mgm101p-domain-containing protein [Hypoxylon fragiforme]